MTIDQGEIPVQFYNDGDTYKYEHMFTLLDTGAHTNVII